MLILSPKHVCTRHVLYVSEAHAKETTSLSLWIKIKASSSKRGTHGIDHSSAVRLMKSCESTIASRNHRAFRTAPNRRYRLRLNLNYGWPAYSTRRQYLNQTQTCNHSPYTLCLTLVPPPAWCFISWLARPMEINV